MSDDLTRRLAIEALPTLDMFGDTFVSPVDEDWVHATFALAAARIADLKRQLAEVRDKALEEARYAAAMARWEGWPLHEDASDDYRRGLEVGRRQQGAAVENAIRNLKGPTP